MTGRPRKQWLLPLTEVLRRYGEGESSETLRVECGLSNVHPILRAVREAGMDVRPAHGPSGPRKRDLEKWETRTCKRDGCENTFEIYKSRNTRYCSRQCRYDDPYLRMLLSEVNTKHKLSNVDESSLTATCSVCGPDARVRTRGKRGFRCWIGEKAWGWAKEYGVTADFVLAVLEHQGGKCAVCTQRFTEPFRVDHDHETGVFRGLLCNKCNLGIGLLGDNVESLRAALTYLINAKSSELATKVLGGMPADMIKRIVDSTTVVDGTVITWRWDDNDKPWTEQPSQ